MPSGSRGGFGGGRSGGGSFGGGRSGGGRSGGGPHVPRRPIPLRFGRRTIIISTGRQNILSVLMFFILVGIMLIFTGISQNAQSLNKTEIFEQRYAYYQQMITTAETDSANLIKTGTITSKLYDSTVKKWYFTYSLPMNEGGILTGESLAVYDLTQIGAFLVGASVELAVDSSIIISTTDSVPTDFKGMPIERDGDWLYYKNTVKSQASIFIWGGVGLIVICIAAGVLVVFVKQKKEEEAKVEAQKLKEEARIEAKRQEAKNFCPYCNCKVFGNESKCPNCGGSLR